MLVLSRVQLFVTPWAVPASLFMGFPRQEYWSGEPFPSQDLPDPRRIFLHKYPNVKKKKNQETWSSSCNFYRKL